MARLTYLILVVLILTSIVVFQKMRQVEPVTWTTNSLAETNPIRFMASSPIEPPKILSFNTQHNDIHLTDHENRTNCQMFLALDTESSWLDLVGEYATFLSFVYQNRYKNRLVLSDQVRTSLTEFFPNITLPGISELPCHFEPFEELNISLGNQTFETETKQFKKKNLLIKTQTRKFSLILNHRKVLRYELQFHAQHDEVVRRSLFRVDRNMPMISKDRPRVFVGVQIKRLDVDLKTEWLSTKEYYFKAMEVLRARYGRNCVFIIIADDPVWAHAVFSSFSDVVFSDQIAREHVPPHLFDFILLTKCNHTIISHGTLGIWGSFLGEGDVIAPDSMYFAKPNPMRTIMTSGFFNTWQTLVDPAFLCHSNKILLQRFDNLLPM